jgi:hypothetical protein
MWHFSFGLVRLFLPTISLSGSLLSISMFGKSKLYGALLELDYYYPNIVH